MTATAILTYLFEENFFALLLAVVTEIIRLLAA